MAKKKSKKDDDKKSKKLKKKAQEKKIAKKKEAKKKAKKKEAKKKEAKKKEAKKKKHSVVLIPEPVVPAKKVASTTKEIKEEDHSSNYNVKEAVVRLRAQKSKSDILSFTKGETRITVTKVIPAALNRFA